MQISVSKALAVNAWPKPKPSLSTSWLTAPCPCSIRKNNLLAPKFSNTTILNTSRHSSNGLQLERKLPYLLTTCSVSLLLCTHGKLKVKREEQHAHGCQEISQNCEGQPALTALPAIPAKLQRLPDTRKELQYLHFPVTLSLGIGFREAWQRLLALKQ